MIHRKPSHSFQNGVNCYDPNPIVWVNDEDCLHADPADEAYSTTEQRARETGVMPRYFSLTAGSGRIHQLYSFRQARLHGTVLLTSECGQVYNLTDVSRHGIGPTCRRCEQSDRRWAR